MPIQGKHITVQARIRADAELRDYMIVHELLHFFVPNHGRLWKSLMRAHLGEYEAYESALKGIARNKALRRTY